MPSNKEYLQQQNWKKAVETSSNYIHLSKPELLIIIETLSILKEQSFNPTTTELHNEISSRYGTIISVRSLRHYLDQLQEIQAIYIVGKTIHVSTTFKTKEEMFPDTIFYTTISSIIISISFLIYEFFNPSTLLKYTFAPLLIFNILILLILNLDFNIRNSPAFLFVFMKFEDFFHNKKE